MEISWVTIERWEREWAGPPSAGRTRPYRDDAERLSDGQLLEKLSGFGIELDRAGLETLCQGAFSAQEVAAQLTSRYLTEAQTGTPESDWVWLAVLTLWQRWWPAKPCLETLDDKIQDGYETLAQDGGAATDRWLDAWSYVLALCEAAGITMIAAFDARFPLTQSLYNWSQDLEMELGNAGHDDPAKLQARITVGEQVMRQFTDCDQLMIENWRRAIAEAWFGLGDNGKADELYRGWLDADPAWGFGWIGWPRVTCRPAWAPPRTTSGRKTCCAGDTPSAGCATATRSPTGCGWCARRPGARRKHTTSPGKPRRLAPPPLPAQHARPRPGATSHAHAAAARSTRNAVSSTRQECDRSSPQH
jgi:hypothetical protein